jgi:hypothetical protein
MQRVLESAIALPFRLGSALRGARVVHPQGLLCRGSWEIHYRSALAPAAQALRAGARHPVIARVSRGLGLPERVGDFFAVAVRLVDAYGPGRDQDLLINASSGLPGLRHLFLPAPRWFAQPYSTCLPYRAGGDSFVIGLVPPSGRGPDPSLAAMRAAIDEGVSFEVVLSRSLGRWERVGILRLSEPLPPDAPDVDFDPWNTGGGLVPATWLNRIRREAYRQSRHGRGRSARPAPASPN